MNDSRPRNDHGQFAPEVQGELDANNTSAAYNPQIIENRKATLGEKLRRAIGLRGGVEESVPKQLSMKTHKAQLKELASRSQVAYEQEVQPQQSNHSAKLAALGIGLGLGVGGGVAGYKLLKPAVGKIVSSAETIANAAKTGIPQAADAVTGAANNAKSAMSIGSDMGKAWDWLKATRAGNQVKRGAWNLAHPKQWAQEIKGGLSMMSPASLKEAVAVGERRQAAFSKWKAGAKNPTAEQAALVRKNLKKTIQQPKPPEANRPAWASGDTLFNAKLRLRELAVKEFADPKKEPLSLKQKVGIGAGLGAAAVGATLMPAAASMFRIKSRDLAHSALAWGAKKRGLRAIIKPPKGDPNRHGRFVADYVDAAQSVLNKGIQGKIAGKVIQHAKANPTGKVAKAVGGELGDYGVSHYARFRSGPREAMAHWDSEVGDLINHKGKQKGILGADNNIVAGANPNAVRTVNRRRGEMDRGRKAVNDEVNEQLWHHGKSESEALRHVAENTKNKDSLAYFRNLAHHNAGAADKYAKISLAAPGLVIAGGATAGLSARRKENTQLERLDAKLRLRELARGDYAIPALGNHFKRLYELASLSQRQVDRRDMLSDASGVAGAGMVGAGGVAAYRAINPSVGITYGKTNAYRGHLSHAEDVKKILDTAGIKSSMHNANPRGFYGSQKHSVMINTGFGPTIIGANKVKFKPDYTSATDSVLPVMPASMSEPIKARKRTVGVYGGGGGVDVGPKVPHLAKVHGDFDAIHLYAGPRSKDVKPGYAGGGFEEAEAAVAKLAKTDPVAASKFKIHSVMNRKAIKNAIRAHSVNIGNAGAGTMHEIASSPNPGILWQSGAYASNHFKDNEALAHRYGARVARGANDIARNDDAVAHLKHIIRDKQHAVNRQKDVAHGMMRDGAKSRAEFVDTVRGALKKGRNRNIAAAAVLGGGGLLLGANAIRNRNQRKP